MQIDHDPNEPPVDRSPGPWRWVFPVLLIGVALSAFTRGLDWVSFAGGVALGGVFTAWIIEITENKVPTSWRRDPTRPR